MTSNNSLVPLSFSAESLTRMGDSEILELVDRVPITVETASHIFDILFQGEAPPPIDLLYNKLLEKGYRPPSKHFNRLLSIALGEEEYCYEEKRHRAIKLILAIPDLSANVLVALYRHE